jgi:hypothetical protein
LALQLKLWQLAEKIIPEDELIKIIQGIYSAMPSSIKRANKNNETPQTIKICLIKTSTKTIKAILKIPHKTEGPAIINGKIQWNAIITTQHLDWIEHSLDQYLTELRQKILLSNNNQALKRAILDHDLEL